MAEPGTPHPETPQPDGPRPPTPRPRGDRGRDPVALAAWRRVAEQRRRAGGRGGSSDEEQVAEEQAAVSPAASSSAVEGAAAADDPEEPAPESAPPESAPPAADLDGPTGAWEQQDAAPTGPGGPTGSAAVGLEDGPPSAGRLHDVLLGLAGRLDDDALSSVREMVAVEDDAEAAELLAGCLLADRVGVTDDERAVLRPWFTAARVDPELLGALPVDAGALGRSLHRFATTAGDRAAGLTLARAARRLSGVVSVRESWRITPAGSAPGPVPHRVVLVETSGADDCDHVVHHLAHAAQPLVDTSVEVFAAGSSLPAYHRDALAAAHPLAADDAPDEAPASRVAPARLAPSRPVAPAPAPAPAAVPEPMIAPEPMVAPEPIAVPEPPAAAEPAPVAPPEPDVSEAAETSEGDEEPEAAEVGETSLDDDLSSTARRIAALWARPSPEDFSAPLDRSALGPTRLEPDGSDTGRRHLLEPPSGDDDFGLADLEPDEDDAPSGRHGRAPASDLGTTSFRSPRTRSRTNGHRPERDRLPAADPDPRPTDPRPTDPRTAGPYGDDEHRGGTVPPPPAPAAYGASAPGDDPSDPDTAQVLRARHSRARDGEADASPEPFDPGPARFGHDARFGAGPGPAWPGAPVSGDGRPGPDTIFTSPVEVGEEPATFGTNGHRHDPVVPGTNGHRHEPGTNGHRHEPVGTNGHRHDPVPDDEPATGPVAWLGPQPPVPPPGRPTVIGPPAGPPPGYPAGPVPPGPIPPGQAGHGPGPFPAGPFPGGAGPRPPGGPGEEIAPPWAANGTGWAPENPGPARPPEPDATASWTPDLDDSVAQLSDRERELLARLHEELAQRERAEGADPFGGPSRPDGQGPQRRSGPGGRVNGHGLPPDGPDDAGA
jgi:hypothetical protein